MDFTKNINLSINQTSINKISTSYFITDALILFWNLLLLAAAYFVVLETVLY